MKLNTKFSVRGMPSFEDTLAKRAKQSMSKYPLRLLGRGANDTSKTLYMMEEEREVNFHIIGDSRQGKSKYIEYHIRTDIDLIRSQIGDGLGLCLIDPSDYGATFNSILDYCASINHEKVCIIDPNTLYEYGAVACIQPFNREFPTKSAQGVKDAINMLLGSSEANTQNIQENLDALFRMAAAEGLTIHDTSYFADYENPNWRIILDKSEGHDAQTLKEKFKTYGSWKDEFKTTVRRLKDFRVEPLSLMIGADRGIDFKKMVEEGWVILCNLFPEPHLNPKTSTFLGILIISQIIQAVDALKREHRDKWKRKFYLYIDEAGSFATPQIEFLLNNKSKSGLHLIFAHHNFDQFASQGKVLSAITHNTGIKVMFGLRDDTDKMRMMRLMSFEDPKGSAQTYANLPVSHAVIKKNKEYPLEVTTPRIESIFVPPSIREPYIRERLKETWYLSKGEIEKQIKARINYITDDTGENTTRGNPLPSGERAAPDSQTISDTPKTRPSSLFDLGADAEQFIRNNSPVKPNVSDREGN